MKKEEIKSDYNFEKMIQKWKKASKQRIIDAERFHTKKEKIKQKLINKGD